MELEFVRWLRGRLPSHPRLLLGAGDDAAVLQFDHDARSIISVDMLTEGVDFDLSQTDPRRIGRKALAVNLSDLAAMAARPIGCVIALALPRSGGMTLAQEIYEGLIPLAQQHDVAIAGGDTNSWDGPLVISVTVFGEPTGKGPLVRSARAGDKILVTGQFGGSILGHHFDFDPRVREAIWLHENVELQAGMDVSDGLSLDLARMAEESGCGACLEMQSIPIRDAACDLSDQLGDGQSALDHALADGEDFELILAVGPAVAEDLIRRQPLACGLTCIGEFVSERGLWQSSGGTRMQLVPRGFVHRLES